MSTTSPSLRALLLIAMALTLPLAACGDDDAREGQELPGVDAGADGGGSDVPDAGIEPDAQPDTGQGEVDLGPLDSGVRDSGSEDLGQAEDAGQLDGGFVEDGGRDEDLGGREDAGSEDGGVDAGGEEEDLGPLPELELRATATVPTNPLAEAELTSCPVYLEERCESGRIQRCAVYDPATEAFVEEPDPLLKRTLLYDRWYDLHGSPDGQTAERVFTEDMLPETPEETWAAPEHFAGWAGLGDSAIWTGVSLTADAFRYATTGTEADYQRVERRTRTLLTMFDVTGVPGYLARYHFLWMPAGTAQTDEHAIKIDGVHALGSRDLPMPAPEAVPDLPSDYLEGIAGPDGQRIQGTPMWHGHPSIDQYTGPMVAFPIVYDLLRDEALKQRIVRHMTCYLHRLQRIELVNLDANPQILQLVTEFFAGGRLNLDPTDIDLMDTDRLVAYAHRGMNPSNVADFDTSCRDFVAVEPDLVLDATAQDFIPRVLDLAEDLQENEERPGQIDHLYVPSVRGGDASHLIHLAAMAYYLTGDDQYREFLYRELIDRVRADGVALTMQSLRQPDWCFKYYGDHITYGTHWQLLQLLTDSPLRDTMLQVMDEELWDKALHNHHSAKFNIMYASVDPQGETLQHVAEARDSALLQLERFGGGGEVIDSPRRTYHVDRAWVLDEMSELGIGTRCPTEEERAYCEEGETVMGIPLGGQTISYECDGRPAECVMDDGLCVPALADDGLPPRLRKYADSMWQRSPFQIGEPHNPSGRKQSPGRDLSEPYWMARYYGFIEEGAGQVLAWEDQGECPQ